MGYCVIIIRQMPSARQANMSTGRLAIFAFLSCQCVLGGYPDGLFVVLASGRFRPAREASAKNFVAVATFRYDLFHYQGSPSRQRQAYRKYAFICFFCSIYSSWRISE
jgi:hypothetical protein